MSKVEYINESCLCHAVIWCTYYIQLNLFKHIGGIIQRVIPNSSIDGEISLWGNRIVLSGVIYHEPEQSHCRHYTSGVNFHNSWFLICDVRILRQQTLQCSTRDIITPYILIYKKSNFLVAPPNSLIVKQELVLFPNWFYKQQRQWFNNLFLKN